MYAVIESGGKQYRVSPGDVIQVEKLDTPEGQTVDFSQVLLVSDDQGVRVGNPVLSGAMVTAKVKSHPAVPVATACRRWGFRAR